jgi:soluble lytic murein transglycosylase-like protein
MKNRRMQKYAQLVVVKIFILICAYTPYSAMADVYVDLSQANEISIGNAEPDKYYAIRIEEPVATQVLALPGSDTAKNFVASQLPYHQEVLLAANETAIEPALIHAVIATESKHNARAKSNKGALGLMQLMPATARRFNVKDRNDPKQNILAGSKYLRELLNLYQGDLKLTLAAYNAGPGAVQKYSNQIPPYKETMRYVPKVLKYYKKYS